MIDLHCHVLPGIDDGPADERETRELLRALRTDGVDMVAATPHFRSDYPLVDPQMTGQWTRRAAEWGEGGRPVVVPGGEVSLTWALQASDEDLALASYNQIGKDVLIETPYGPAPANFDEMLLRVTMRGYRVLLAHPERNEAFQNQPQRLARLVARGVLLQVNASSIANPKRSSRSRRLAMALIQEELAHVIATDAHSAGWRPPKLSEAVRIAEAQAGPRARWMTTAAPAAILAGAPLPPAPARGARRGRTASS